MSNGRSEQQRIGDYAVLKRLGTGAFGDAFLVKDRYGEELALKRTLQAEGDFASRLETEAKVLAQLTHPGIPEFVEYSVGHDGFPYLVMGLAQGRTMESALQERRKKNSRFSDYETLQFMREMLGILVYLSEADSGSGRIGWVHRDIKSANVMMSDSLEHVSLIDFGFCKENGATDKRLDDSFFRAGAARYAPPAKHQRPATAKATHDVFAVGVLAYQMLTGTYPWSAGIEEDDGALLELMRRPPEPITAANNTVRNSVASFVEGLLSTEDAFRPSASDALVACNELIEETGRSAAVATREPRYQRVWRDPLYGDVRLTNEEMRVIDTPEMQRLRGYAQLGLSYLVYEGARHSRLSHSVGCVQRVEMILSGLEKAEGVRIDPELRLVARMFALTHDVTHIAVGHTLEDEYGFFAAHDRNEGRTSRLVFDPSSSQLASVLQETTIGREVRSLFDLDSTIRKRTDVIDLVSGPFGADVLDYVDRDSYFAGLDHRVDSASLRQLRIIGSGDRDDRVVSLSYGAYGVRADRQYALEWLYEQRYALYLKVYAHKTKLKASALLARALAICVFEGSAPALTEEQIEQAPSDQHLLELIARSNRDRARRLIDDLLVRRLPAAVYRATLLSQADVLSGDFQSCYSDRIEDLNQRCPGVEGLLELETQLARRARVKRDHVFVYLARSAPGYKRTQSHRFVIDESGSLSAPDDSWFQRLRRKHLSLWEVWVLIDPSASEEERTRLAREAESEFGAPNSVRAHSAQLRLGV